jgi:hypothetical protein
MMQIARVASKAKNEGDVNGDVTHALAIGNKALAAIDAL